MGEMKAVVVFYSRTGTTRKVAEIIGGMLKCHIEEIVDTKNRAGAWGYLVAGKDSAMKNLTVIQGVKRNPALYDVVIIGTPVWAWHMSPPVRTYIAQQKEKFKNLAFFCTMGGSGSKGTFGEMEALCGKKPLAVLALTAKEVAVGGFGERIKRFIEEMGLQA
jgi:flavodoxin